MRPQPTATARGSAGSSRACACRSAVGSDGPIGALAFNTLRVRRDWSDATVKRLRLIAQVFTNALERRRIDEALRTSEARLESAADLADLAFYELDYRGAPATSTTGFATSAAFRASLNDGRLSR